MSTVNVPSESKPGQSYRVDVHEDVAVCDCPGFLTHGHCKHVKEILMTNGSEAEDVDTQEVTALALRVPDRLLPTVGELSVMGKIARTLVQASGHAIPKTVDTSAKAAAIMLAGWEIGLRPMNAFRHIFVVNGRTELDAQAMMGLVKSSDTTADFIFHRYDPDACDVELRRNGRRAARCEYTIEDAQRSGQTKSRDGDKSAWTGFARDMLAWAAVKRVCRLGAPDLINVFSGISVADADALLTEPVVEADEDGVIIERPEQASPDEPDPRGDPSMLTAKELENG